MDEVILAQTSLLRSQMNPNKPKHPTCIQPLKSVAHGVDHHVDSDFVSRQSILHRIRRDR
jgi:hypothetical protein